MNGGDDVGGGASRSTDPAAGSSAATDVSLREYIGSQMRSLERHLTNEIAALRRETTLAIENSDKAVAIAAHEASERLAAHNGLIEQMRQQSELHRQQSAALAASFAKQETFEEFKNANDRRMEERKDTNDSRFGRIERFQAMLTGGMILVSFLGIANLVRSLTG